MIEDVAVRDAGRKGLGVFALRQFRKGEFIFRRRHGRIVANAEIPSLTREDRRHLCELDYARSAVLLAPGCYLNHSCEPNAMRAGVKVFAWKRIRAGEEITIDYRLNAFSGDRWKCSCRSASCTGEIVGDFFSLSTGRQREYLRFAPSFIQREYRWRASQESHQERVGSIRTDVGAAGGTAQRVSREARVPRGPARSERSELQGGEGALRERPA